MKSLRASILILILILAYLVYGNSKSNMDSYSKCTTGNDISKDTLINSDTSGCVVYVSIIIDQKGVAEQVKVDSCKCDSNKRYIRSIKKEAIRVVKSMPDWKPMYKEGKPVRAKYTIPIKFTNNPDTIN